MPDYPDRSHEDVAKHFGLAHQTIKGWARDWPRECERAGGGYDLAAIARWRLATLRRPPSGTDLANQERRIDIEQKRIALRAKRRAEEIELGNLLPRDRVEAECGLALVKLQQAVLAVPPRLACEPDRAAAERQLRDALAETSAALKKIGPRVEAIAAALGRVKGDR